VPVSSQLPAPLDDAAALAVERDRVIARLSRHFALDELSIDELDARIERAYRARTADELAALTIDLHPVHAGVQSTGAQLAATPYAGPLAEHEEHGRLLAFMSSLKRRGPWAVPRNLELVSVMSETQLDLREARLAPGVTDIKVFALMTSLKITVPPGVRVVDHTTSFMAEVRNESLDDPTEATSPCIVRLRGSAVMAEVVIRALPIGAKMRR
jgi:hypothetical protein